MVSTMELAFEKHVNVRAESSDSIDFFAGWHARGEIADADAELVRRHHAFADKTHEIGLATIDRLQAEATTFRECLRALLALNATYEGRIDTLRGYVKSGAGWGSLLRLQADERQAQTDADALEAEFGDIGARARAISPA